MAETGLTRFPVVSREVPTSCSRSRRDAVGVKPLDRSELRARTREAGIEPGVPTGARSGLALSKHPVYSVGR